MQQITLEILGMPLDFDLARQLADTIAHHENDDCTLISWYDGLNNRHSPQAVCCEIKGLPGWEVYGQNHGGRVRISFNNDTLVLIYS